MPDNPLILTTTAWGTAAYTVETKVLAQNLSPTASCASDESEYLAVAADFSSVGLTPAQLNGEVLSATLDVTVLTRSTPTPSGLLLVVSPGSNLTVFGDATENGTAIVACGSSGDSIACPATGVVHITLGTAHLTAIMTAFKSVAALDHTITVCIATVTAGESIVLNGAVAATLTLDIDEIEPTIQAHDLVASAFTSTGMAIALTKGNGTSRAIFVAVKSEAGVAAATPVDTTVYTANTVFKSGSRIGTTAYYCVYNGTGAGVTITGLTPGVQYVVKAIEYNEGPLYLQDDATLNPIEPWTKCPAPQLYDPVDIQGTTLYLNWPATLGATGYTLEHALSAAFESATSTELTNVLTTIVESLTAGTAYWFRLSAKNTSGTGATSNVVVGQTRLIYPLRPSARRPSSARPSSYRPRNGYTP